MASRSPPRVPAVPDTAAVLQFTCLYTHDLTRKRKRWQDGRLRFHTFNKRIMVYDADGNFIDGQHRRTDNTVSESDDFQLDGGVLVQVEEQQRTERQDLTELVKQRKSREVQHAAETDARIASGTGVRDGRARDVQSSAMRPKTISEVLKLSRTSTARAAQAMAISPYEEAHLNRTPTPKNMKASSTEQQKPPSRGGVPRNVAVASLPQDRSRKPPRLPERAKKNAATHSLGNAKGLSNPGVAAKPNGKRPSPEVVETTPEAPKRRKLKAAEFKAVTDRSRAHSPLAESCGGRAKVIDPTSKVRSDRLHGRLRLGTSKRHKLVCANERDGPRKATKRGLIHDQTLNSMTLHEPSPCLDVIPASSISSGDEALVAGNAPSDGSTCSEISINFSKKGNGDDRPKKVKGLAELRQKDDRSTRRQNSRMNNTTGELPAGSPSLFVSSNSDAGGPSRTVTLKRPSITLPLHGQALESAKTGPAPNVLASEPDYSLSSNRCLSSSYHSAASKDDDEEVGPWTREAFDLFG